MWALWPFCPTELSRQSVEQEEFHNGDQYFRVFSRERVAIAGNAVGSAPTNDIVPCVQQLSGSMLDSDGAVHG